MIPMWTSQRPHSLGRESSSLLCSDPAGRRTIHSRYNVGCELGWASTMPLVMQSCLQGSQLEAPLPRERLTRGRCGQRAVYAGSFS